MVFRTGKMFGSLTTGESDVLKLIANLPSVFLQINVLHTITMYYAPRYHCFFYCCYYCGKYIAWN